MKIYFAGSIRGGRGDIEIYIKIINHLKKHGEVLTEHIGDQKLTQIGEKNISEEEIYERDMKWLKQSHVVVADVSTPSLGVGYELREAELSGKMVLCLYRKQPGKRLSSMIVGNKRFIIKEYTDIDEALKIIDEFFKDNMNVLKPKDAR